MIGKLTEEFFSVIKSRESQVTLHAIISALSLVIGRVIISLSDKAAREETKTFFEDKLPVIVESAMARAAEKYGDAEQHRQPDKHQRPGRRRGTLATGSAAGYGVLPIPDGASPLTKQLAQGILRAALNGIGEGGDPECEQRALASFIVLCSMLASIRDDGLRNSLIEDLTRTARQNVSMLLQVKAEVAAMAAAAGMSVPEMSKLAYEDGIGEPLPEEPQEH
jgi:hypothetical protein